LSFSVFVSANGRSGLFLPHRKAEQAATALRGEKQGQMFPLVDGPERGVQPAPIPGECPRAADRADAAFPDAWFPVRAPFSQIRLLVEYAGGRRGSSYLPLWLVQHRSFVLLALPRCSAVVPAIP